MDNLYGNLFSCGGVSMPPSTKEYPPQFYWSCENEKWVRKAYSINESLKNKNMAITVEQQAEIEKRNKQKKIVTVVFLAVVAYFAYTSFIK